MDGKNGLVPWVLGGIGVTLMWAAFKNQTPLSVIQNALGQAVPSTPIAATPSRSSSGSFGTANTSEFIYPVHPLYDKDGIVVGDVPTAYQLFTKSYIDPQGARVG